MNTNATIVAPATPPGYGGVSIVRLSGPQSRSIIKKITRLNSLENRTSTLTSIYDKGGKFDDVLVCFFKNPNSYTGEDVVEVSCHGNPIIVDTIVSLAVQHGAVLAEPGEFTKRAFINGRLDLIQAESVAQLIESKSLESARLNNKTLAGVLSAELLFIRENLISALSELEFEFDISEDELPRPNLIKNIHKTINNNILRCDGLIKSFTEGRLLSRGARVVLCGEPNVGKSTLMNAILQQDRAIVSQTPGTTRDTIDATIVLSGLPITFIDTAGVREKADTLELMGIQRTNTEITNADLVLNIASPQSQHIDNTKVNPRQVRVFNKTDLLRSDRREKNTFYVSAKNNTGVGELKKLILSYLISTSKSQPDTLLTSRRQLVQVQKCESFLKNANSLLIQNNTELELVAHEIHGAISSIDVLLGKTTVDDILNRVFSGFCVGK